MAKLPCPQCGNPDVIGTFCESCLRERSPLVSQVREVKLTFCSRSGEVKIANAWERLKPEEAIRRVVKRALVYAPEAKIERFDVGDAVLPELLNKPGMRRRIEVQVIVRGRAEDGLPSDYDEEYGIPIIIETTISPKHAKAGSQYFEAIIQTRNEREAQREALRVSAARRDAMINKEEPIKRGKGGTDYYLADKKTASIIAQALHERFGGILKHSSTLFSRDKQTGKDLYRDTFLVEYPDFDVGDILTDDKLAFRVGNLGKIIMFENLTTGKKKGATYEPGKFTKMERRETTVSQVEPTLAVIDPDTFQQVAVQNTKTQDLSPGGKVTVVKLGELIWVVP